ncbi:MAG TPA: crossover junction endodeoxyribonuclease RuvC [Polyangiaceae bacterium]|nr:crossover junction endodeoxyribonuclease RuvC [Polyangiaceae bacterium]
MIALGIDPGSRHFGWGVIRSEGNRIAHVAHGVIDVDPALSLALRLAHIDTNLSKVIAQYRPDVGSVETLFFHRDPQAASKLGHARGVALLGLARAGVQVAEYAPAHVKRAVAGKGNADKRQVAHMVRALLALAEPPRSDAADALALAITHCRRGPIDDAIDARRSALPPELAALFGKKRRPRAGGFRRAPD